jgi:DNA-binding transcriptional regulator of glucitol operon
MGRLWAVMQVVPLVAYCSLMSLHWQYALLFSSTVNTMISLGVVFLWGSISLFLPVF